MPVPKRQHSRSRSGKRAGGKHKILRLVGHCSTCSSSSIQHAVCQDCGFYRGVKVLRTKSERAQERTIVRQIKERARKNDIEYRKMLEERMAQNLAAEGVADKKDE